MTDSVKKYYRGSYKSGIKVFEPTPLVDHADFGKLQKAGVKADEMCMKFQKHRLPEFQSLTQKQFAD